MAFGLYFWLGSLVGTSRTNLREQQVAPLPVRCAVRDVEFEFIPGVFERARMLSPETDA